MKKTSSRKVQRRAFVGSALAAAAGLGPAARALGQGKPKAAVTPEYYELRAYKLRIGAQPKQAHDFFAEVYLPLAARLGAKTVGAFTLMFGPELPTIYLLTPFASLAAYGTFQEQLAAELPKQKSAAAQAFLGAPATQPAYVRMENQLLQAFPNLPRLEIPAGAAKKEPRIFELRTYETPGEAAQARKMEMFTPGLGELEIFRRTGLTPVFFGRTVVGPRQPSFTYMLTFPDFAAREAAWKRFREDPEWQKLKATAGYTDAEIMANISDLVLTPAPYSQI